jgi:hypothetical protein
MFFRFRIKFLWQQQYASEQLHSFFEAEATGVVATDCFPINKTLLGFKPD